jgi:hypothetical protein
MSDEVKYLRITLTSDISWGKQIRYICGRALKKLGFIKHVVQRYLDEKVKETCHFALVRLHLEYAASIWDPGHKELNRILNKVRRKAVPFVKKPLRADTECHSGNYIGPTLNIQMRQN